MAVRGVTAADLERYRLALREAIAGSSLRAVARAVEMSPTGLANFLEGSMPYGPTVERLRVWYYSTAGVHQTPPDEIVSLLRRLVVTLPEPDAGVRNLLAAVDASYRDAGMFAPEWVGSARALAAA